MTSAKMPVITWETGIKHEALRLIYWLQRLPTQDLQRRGFLVLPTPIAKYHNRIIVFPDLPYQNIPHVWQKTAHLPSITPMSAPESLVEEVINLLQPTYHSPQAALNKFQDQWSQIDHKFFSTLFALLPGSSSKITKINVIICHCGSCSQFNALKENLTELTVYLRADANITDLIQVIVLSLIRHPLQNLEKRTWEEIETVSDFLLAHTSLKEAIAPFNLTTMMPRLQQNQSGKLQKMSQQYQAHLGIPINHNWHLRDNHVFYQDIKIDQLTQRQNKLLKMLVEHQGEVVNNDQIAEILWPDGTDFSLWAIVKEIARIRAVFKSLNLPGSLLQSHRKIGYSLN